MDQSGRIRVLAIGNSFSEDGVEYLYDILKDAGYEDVVIGNLVIGGCSLETHAHNVRNNAPAYLFDLFKEEGRTRTEEVNLKTGLKAEAWDVITFQQVSGLSGLADSYEPYLGELITYVKEHVDPKVRFGWQMTWAYQNDSDHHDFIHYKTDQKTMVQMIMKAVKKQIVGHPDISFIIPTGTAIQNARKVVGDTLTRDGFHLSLDFGRYIASLTWFQAITGNALEEIAFRPVGVREDQVKVAKRAVASAIAHPFEVSK